MNAIFHFKTLQARVASAAGLCLVIVGAALIVYASLAARQVAVQQAEFGVQTEASKQAAVVEKEMNKAQDVARTLAQALAAVKSREGAGEISRTEIGALVRGVMEANPDLAGVYTVWEPQAFDGQDAAFAGAPGHDKSGRFMAYYSPDEYGNVKLDVAYAYDTDSYYLCPRDTRKDCVSEPTPYVVQGREILLTSLTSPILSGDKFYGIVGVDISLAFLQQLSDDVDFLDKAGKLRIYSNKGILSGGTGEQDMIGKPLSELTADKNGSPDMLVRDIQQGTAAIHSAQGLIHALSPVRIGNTETPWAVEMIVPENIILSQATTDTRRMIVIAACLILAGLLIVWFMVGKTVSQPIRLLVAQADRLAAGDVAAANTQIDVSAKLTARPDEIGAIARAFSALQEYQAQISAAAQSVAAGELKLDLTSRGEQDLLGITFLEMVSRLRATLQGVQQNAVQLKDAAQRLDRDSTQSGEVSGQIAKTIQHIADAAARQTEDITRAVSSLDEIAESGHSITRGSQGQVQAVTQAAQAMHALSASIQKIRRGAEDQTSHTLQNRQALESLDTAVSRLMNGAETQNQGLDQATQTYERLSIVIKSITGFIRETAQDTEKTARQAKEGMQVIEKTTHSMEQVHAGTASLSTSIHELSQRTNQINDIIATIKEIAGQTNLIALNAAIEAARSGSQVKTIAEDLLAWQILVQCHLFADLLVCEDSRSWDQAKWEEICKRAGIDTFLVSDADGVIRISNETALLNWRFPDDPKEQAFVFRELIYRDDGVVIQKFQQRSFDKKMYKWVGISRRDEPGIIQIGLNYEISRLAEQSGGFSVLAQEVRKLAEKASSASGEIAKIIQTVQTGAQETVTAMQKTGKDISAASELTLRAQEAFIGIVQGTITSTDRVQTVQNAIEEMEAASADLNEAVIGAHAIARQNLTAAAEMTSMSRANAGHIEEIHLIAEDNLGTASDLTALNQSLVEMLENLSRAAGQNEAAIDEMTRGLEAIRQRIENVARLSEGNSAAAEEASAATEEMSAQTAEISAASHGLSDMSQDLHQTVAYFNL